MDRDKLKESVAAAIALADFDSLEARAESALSVIEEAGYALVNISPIGTPTYDDENSDAAASAVWDEAVEACAQAIKEVEKELAAEGEVYILVKAVEQMRALKRSPSPTESTDG